MDIWILNICMVNLFFQFGMLISILLETNGRDSSFIGFVVLICTEIVIIILSIISGSLLSIILHSVILIADIILILSFRRQKV